MTPLDALRKRGWRKGGTWGADGSMCLIGGWLYSGEPVGWLAECADVIREQYPDRALLRNPAQWNLSGVIALFNDNDATTFTDIELVCTKTDLRLSERVQ